jgi:hypothetical protein
MVCSLVSQKNQNKNISILQPLDVEASMLAFFLYLLCCAICVNMAGIGRQRGMRTVDEC